MADTGYRDCAWSTGDFTDGDYAFVSDTLYATETTANSIEYYWGFNWGAPAIPDGSTIDGVVVEGQMKITGTPLNGDRCLVRYAVSNVMGSSYSANKDWSIALDDPEQYFVFGSPTDLWGLSGWAKSSFQFLMFRVRITMVRLYLGASLFKLNHVRVKVYYTPPSGVPQIAQFMAGD